MSQVALECIQEQPIVCSPHSRFKQEKFGNAGIHHLRTHLPSDLAILQKLDLPFRAGIRLRTSELPGALIGRQRHVLCILALAGRGKALIEY